MRDNPLVAFFEPHIPFDEHLRMRVDAREQGRRVLRGREVSTLGDAAGRLAVADATPESGARS